MGRGLPWEGVFAAIITPFDEDGRIDEKGFSTIVERFTEWGIHGLVIAGHNGESWALRAGERSRLVRLARGVFGDRLPVVVGIDAVAPAEIIEEAHQVLDAGADGIMVEPPFLVTTATRDETLTRYRAVLDGAGCPVLVYNNPRRTQINLTLDITVELARHERVVGVKESVRDLAHLIMLIRQVGDDATVFVGPAPFILPGLIMGAKGFISSGPLELLGPRGVELYEAARAGDLERARPLAYTATAMYPVLFGIGTWPASLKAAMKMLGLPAGVPRAPVLPLDRQATEKLRQHMIELGILQGAAARA
ncbi:MAG: dihydrodipicolinate synthase family protein [Armatimonadota bacterium]|nr:dihydrodipicolinate synthase family protein [Armatimonadota bacterium]